MKKFINLIVVAFIATFVLLGCKKDGGNPIQPPANDFAAFLKNTEWVGTLDGNGFQYRPPCSLKFNADNTFKIYGIFVSFATGSAVYTDSISGSIQKIDTLPDGRVRVSITDLPTSPNAGATKYLYVTDKQKISGVDAGVTVETFQLNLFPASGFVVSGSWRGIAWKGGFAYPDLNTVIFDNAKSVTHYNVNGKDVQESAEPTSPVLGVNYAQKGARVYFAGYNDQNPPPGYGGRTIAYFGVLLPTGDKMMVHSVSMYARLPNYVYTSEPNGPNGQTPVINKF
ncbi:MAG: hypothetical protein QM726_12510 [Chitinophagaceae bacterium]